MIPTPSCRAASPRRKEVVELVQGITSQGALADVIDADGEPSAPLTVFEPPRTEPMRRGHPSRWCGPARRRRGRAKHSARWWRPRRSGATSSRPRRGSSWATAGRGSGRSTGPFSRVRADRRFRACVELCLFGGQGDRRLVPTRSGNAISAGPRRAGKVESLRYWTSCAEPWRDAPPADSREEIRRRIRTM